MPIETYLNMTDDKTKSQVLPIISYIEDSYNQAVFDEAHSEKTHIPTWRYSGAYVAVACRKTYISIYFSNPAAAKLVSQNTDTPYVFARKSCVNICYRIKEIPYEAFYKGIDMCFNNTCS